jgi:hypothetical protein
MCRPATPETTAAPKKRPATPASAAATATTPNGPEDETRCAGECGGETSYSVRLHCCTVEGDWEQTQGTDDVFRATQSLHLVAGRAGALRATPSRHGIGAAPQPRFAADSAHDPAPPTTIQDRAATPPRRPSAGRAPSPAL